MSSGRDSLEILRLVLSHNILIKGFGEDKWIFEGNGTFDESFIGNDHSGLGDLANISGTLVGLSDPSNVFDLFLSLTRENTQEDRNRIEIRCNSSALTPSWYQLTLVEGYLQGRDNYKGLTINLSFVIPVANGRLVVGRGASQKNILPGISAPFRFEEMIYDDTLWPRDQE